MKSMCLKHNDEPAVARCKICLKPMCSSCEMKTPEGSFCSNECMAKYKRAQETMAETKKKEEEFFKKDVAYRQKQMVMRFITIVIIAIFIALAWEFLPPEIKKTILKTLHHFFK